ncbi:hypothetical protein K443DRAFT_677646 [Laccaria amethystina LaAM-08-1]|uniref:Uncharacterized protein n=1 Tax=Laccaria amethystina LaAM-08-1 TaxID=1095629 RepID=A0A0C9XLI9_9AGAR|nr:hypothetical protein K443DRAFT_677646 [Laccaria amethystina LaAM-08-1]
MSPSSRIARVADTAAFHQLSTLYSNRTQATNRRHLPSIPHQFPSVNFHHISKPASESPILLVLPFTAGCSALLKSNP